MPQTIEEMSDVTTLVPQKQIQECIVEEAVYVIVPEEVEEMTDAVKTIAQERVQSRTVEQPVDQRVPQNLEELVEVIHLKVNPREPVQQHMMRDQLKLVKSCRNSSKITGRVSGRGW